MCSSSRQEAWCKAASSSVPPPSPPSVVHAYVWSVTAKPQTETWLLRSSQTVFNFSLTPPPSLSCSFPLYSCYMEHFSPSVLTHVDLWPRNPKTMLIRALYVYFCFIFLLSSSLLLFSTLNDLHSFCFIHVSAFISFINVLVLFFVPSQFYSATYTMCSVEKVDFFCVLIKQLYKINHGLRFESCTLRSGGEGGC